MVKESKLVWPEEEKQQQTNLGSQKKFLKLLEYSQMDPEMFWDQVARELHWYERWEQTLVGSLPEFEFFKGGISNPCYNLLDRHIENEIGRASCRERGYV